MGARTDSPGVFRLTGPAVYFDKFRSLAGLGLTSLCFLTRWGLCAVVVPVMAAVVEVLCDFDLSGLPVTDVCAAEDFGVASGVRVWTCVPVYSFSVVVTLCNA